MKIAIVTDSNSGITQAQAKELGIAVIPMPFMINGETYEEDINLTQEQFYAHLTDGAEISTSQPSPETVMKLWDELLGEYDQIVHIPMSSGLSGSCQTAMMLADEDEYEDKVFVVNNQRISVTQRQSALDAKEMAAKGMDGAEIKRVLEETKMESSIYITVDTLKYLKKGGRITPAAAALGTLLRIKPVLQIQGEKLDSFSKARTMKQAKSTMITAIEHDLENRFNDPEAEHTWLQIAYTYDREAAEEFLKEIKERFPKSTGIHMDPLSLSVACHIGPGALAFACTKKLD
ncbi:DegV family protein [Brotaphodocola sp.]|uniref:DegV family protein n=1 Tax=Brotaphodocola sp. TaxID=3073577 RepID=UPI003D7CED1D